MSIGNYCNNNNIQPKYNDLLMKMTRILMEQNLKVEVFKKITITLIVDTNNNIGVYY